MDKQYLEDIYQGGVGQGGVGMSNKVKELIVARLKQLPENVRIAVIGERGTQVSPDGSPAPRGADLTDELSGSGSPAKTKKEVVG